MSTGPAEADPAFADLLDDLLDALQNGDEPDLAAHAERHPGAAHRIDEAFRLACSVAGRRTEPRPALRGYRVVRELGRGGMGTVYLVHQEQLDRQVALKVLPHSFGLSAHSRQRFLEEARALARVHHEHIVGIHRVVDDGDLLAFEMEYVDGPSLQSLLAHLREVKERTGAPPALQHVADLLQLPIAALGVPNLTQFFVHVARKIARALGAVHAAGFVHRDVKPANVLLRKNGHPVLADFGLVRDAGLELTHKTGFAGTPVYSSPEQLRGNAPIGPRTDVYALAVTLYECLTLAPPFAGRTTTDLLSRIEGGRVPPLRRLAPYAPRDLETIVAHAMELEPERRYGNGDEFADDLQRLLDLQPVLARPVSTLRRVGKFLRRNRRQLLAGCFGAALVAAGLLPVLDHVQAAERTAAAARAHVRSARQALLSQECRGSPWQRSGRAGTGPADAASHERGLQALQKAIDEYGLAVAEQPHDQSARRELAVARMLQWLRQLSLLHADSLDQAMATDDYRTRAAALGPLTRRAAEAAAAGSPLPDELGTDLQGADPADREGLGLLAFFVGEYRSCELAWDGLSPSAADQPLHDAVLGLLHLNDGAPERAYVRLQAARRELPEATMVLELADAALAMGETQLAAGWLARTGESPENRYERRRVAADLQVATGDEAAAERVYRELAEAAPLDPTPRHRLAQLAMRSGDLHAAAAQLDTLLVQWPTMPRLRLDRARVALQQRDVPAYLREVLAVLAQAPLHQRATGATADQLEVLRLGGLSTLHRQACEAARGLRSGRAFLGGELPLRAMRPRWLVDELEALLPDLAQLEAQVRSVNSNAPIPEGLVGWTLMTAPLAASRVPRLANLLTVPQRCGCELLPWLSRWAYPRLQPLLRRMSLPFLPGSWSLVSLEPVQTPPDLAPKHLFGGTVVRGSDWNGDGTDDLLVGCTTTEPGSAPGRVVVVDTRTGATIADVRSESTEHMFGHALDSLGDLDGDGIGDWIVGAPAGTRQTKQGFAELRSGRDQRCIAHVAGEGAGFGVSVAGTGDLDGDGVEDFAVGSPPILRNTTGQGRVTVYSGRTREVLRTYENTLAGVWFGACIADAGDTDRDGIHDLVVGGNFGAAPGVVRVHSGRSGAVLHTWSDESPNSGFGSLVTGLGDLDGDGFGEVAVSAVRIDETSGPDQVHLYSGRTGQRLTTFTGHRPGIRFGSGVLRYDQPRRGAPFVAISAALGGGGSCGSVGFYTERGVLVASIQGPIPYANFGSAIAVAQDLDEDGRPEIFVASPRPNGAGQVFRVPSHGLMLPR